MMRSLPIRRRSALGTSLLQHAAAALLPGALLASAACSDSAPTDPGPDGDGLEMPDEGDGGSGGSGGSGAGGMGGSAGTGASAPALRTKVTLTDDALAHQALDLLGASAVNGSGVCKNCHSLGRPTLTQWAQYTQAFSDACLKDADLDDQSAVDAMLGCFHKQAGDGKPLAPKTFGIYAAAARLPWFSYIFDHASGISNRTKEKNDFVDDVGMPQSGTPWTQEQFDIVAEWFARKTPLLLDLVPADQGEACVDGLDQATLSAHVQQMATAGWRAKNAQLPMLNFGCPQGQSGSACLGDFPLASASGATSEWQALGGAQIRVLYDNSETRSTYWSRVSPDGRYLASGLLQTDDDGHNGQIIDLSDGHVIPGNFRYDATFFPDGSGFIFQQEEGAPTSSSDTEPTNGTVSAGAQALTCNYSVLSDSLTELTGEESECSQVNGKLGLYQQLAASVDGSDYWVVHGSYTSDNGGFEPVLNNPSAAYEATSKVTLTPMVATGTGYTPGTAVQVALPRQGDPMLSPSGTLLATRIKGRETTSADESVIAAEQAGYALYTLTKSASGSSSASVTDLGRICVQGGKPTFSYDERWMVFHRYVTESDAKDLGFADADAPGFQDYSENGSSNLYLLDLTDGSITRVTNMPPGEFALFPHFRSDGWIYFVVRTTGEREFFAATDAAILRE
ncbi:MAG TPA: hypothetical protein VFS67_32845 [Polyangiaceae bacterium]|nr:hypothetical protein [Polyangiaceae bacterium]